MIPPAANRGWTPWAYVDRHDHDGVLDGFLNHSPHQPPNRCTAIMASRLDDRYPPLEIRTVLLTPFNGPFVAWIDLCIVPDTNIVFVSALTTEPPVGDASDAFKDRRPVTAPLVGGPLGSTIADMVVNRQEVADEEEGADDEDGEDDDDDGSDSDDDMDGELEGDADGDG